MAIVAEIRRRARRIAGPVAGTAGAILGVKPLVVGCGEGALELQELQLEGRKRLTASEFANGQRLKENESLVQSS